MNTPRPLSDSGHSPDGDVGGSATPRPAPAGSDALSGDADGYVSEDVAAAHVEPSGYVSQDEAIVDVAEEIVPVPKRRRGRPRKNDHDELEVGVLLQPDVPAVLILLG